MKIICTILTSEKERVQEGLELLIKRLLLKQRL